MNTIEKVAAGVLIGGVLLVGLVALEGGGEDAYVDIEEGGETVDEGPDANDSGGGSSTDSGPQQTRLGMGEVGEDDGLAFKVLELNESDRLPASDEATSPPKASSGAKLVSAKVTIKNGGKRKVDPYCGGGGAVLLDEEDRNYEPIAEIYGIKGNTSVCGDGISPRFRDTLTLAFEVPEDMSVAGLVLWNPENEDDPDGDTDQLLVTPDAGRRSF